MAIETTVKQRLILFIKTKGLSQSKFEKAVSFSNGYVNNISKSLGVSKLRQISVIFPDLNTEWLLTGEGSMLLEEKSVNEKITVEGSGNRVAGRDYSEGAGGRDAGGDTCTVVAALRSVIEEKDRRIDDLRAVIAAKDETIAALKSRNQ